MHIGYPLDLSIHAPIFSVPVIFLGLVELKVVIYDRSNCEKVPFVDQVSKHFTFVT